MAKVEVYSTQMCPYCVRAKQLLEKKGARYEEIRVDLEPKRMQEMLDRSKRRTVPQIFINDQHIGGFDDLAALDRAKGLDPLLAQS